MGILSTIKEAATGGLAKEVAGLIKSYFPPDLSEEKRAELNLQLERLELQRAAQTNTAIASAEQAMNERIRLYEGTAADLKTMPVLGPIMLFLRGAQRIVWGFATLYLDWMWFAEWEPLTQKQEAALLVINFLVLGFLFGERAVKNVSPMIAEIFRAKRGD